MTIVNFTPVESLLGGVLVGLSASLLLLLKGRIMGVTGILGGVLQPRAGEFSWRVVFLLGMIAGGVGVLLAQPDLIAPPSSRTLLAVAVAGGLVGFGTRMGGGCTSGHGVCGLTRFSVRSLVAVLTFIATGALAVALAPRFPALVGG